MKREIKGSTLPIRTILPNLLIRYELVELQSEGWTAL